MDRYVSEQKFSSGLPDGWRVWDTKEHRNVCGCIPLNEINAVELTREFNAAYENGKAERA